MKKLIKCKVCGYIMEEKSLKNVCPACGVQKTAFEPYTSRTSEKRENVLSLHIHPILVHLPQGFIILLPIFIISGLVLSQPFKEQLLITARIISIFMPVMVLLAALSGLLDGKFRFKKLKTPELIKKIIFGNVLFALTAILSILILLGFTNYIIMLFFSFIFLICSVFLGKIGAGLMEAKMPG